MRIYALPWLSKSGFRDTIAVETNDRPIEAEPREAEPRGQTRLSNRYPTTPERHELPS